MSTAGGQIRQYRLACDCSLAFAREHLRSFWKVDIDARAESDHANALTYCDRLGFAAKADDSPGDKPCDLDDGQALPGVGDEHKGVSLVVFARFVEPAR